MPAVCHFLIVCVFHTVESILLDDHYIAVLTQDNSNIFSFLPFLCWLNLTENAEKKRSYLYSHIVTFIEGIIGIKIYFLALQSIIW